MLRYDRQTKPGLVALYDIRPGNGAGPFLQPRSPHGARSPTEEPLGTVGVLVQNLLHSRRASGLLIQANSVRAMMKCVEEITNLF